MSKFDRKVERTKKEYVFTHRKEEKKSVFKEHFHLRWIKLNKTTLIVFIADFFISTLIFIPFLMHYVNSQWVFVLGHGLITSLLLVVSVCFINKERISLSAFLTRYACVGLLLAMVSFLSVMVVSWLN